MSFFSVHAISITFCSHLIHFTCNFIISHPPYPTPTNPTTPCPTALHHTLSHRTPSHPIPSHPISSHPIPIPIFLSPRDARPGGAAEERDRLFGARDQSGQRRAEGNREAEGQRLAGNGRDQGRNPLSQGRNPVGTGEFGVWEKGEGFFVRYG